MILLCAFCIAACQGEKKETSAQTEFEEHMTGRDSLHVIGLIEQYFLYQKQGDLYSAAGMLYRLNPENRNYMPEPLNNEQLAQVVQSMKMIPVVDYEIEYIKFSQTYDNEAMCRVVIAKGENGLPDVTTKVFFKPVCYLGSWYLTVIDSAQGDQTTVKVSQRDSVKRNYRPVKTDTPPAEE